MTFNQQAQQWYCQQCGQYQQPAGGPAPQPPQQIPQQQQQMPPQQQQPAAIWYQNFYRIRKKVLSIGAKYYIEDANERILGFCKKKKFRLKEDIRIYSDESKSQELFRIKQAQMVDIWGTFNVIDTYTNTNLGAVQRKGLKSQYWVDEWRILDSQGQKIGKIKEGTLRGLLRKYLSGLIPEKVALELHGQKVAEIVQKFKVIGDIWELDASRIPQQYDRRVVLAGMLLMGLIEKGKN